MSRPRICGRLSAQEGAEPSGRDDGGDECVVSSSPMKQPGSAASANANAKVRQGKEVRIPPAEHVR